MPRMKTFTEQAAEALDLLPEQMRQPAVSYLFEQAEKFRVLKEEIDRGIASAEAGRVREWDFGDFLRRANLADLKPETK
jgi:predicted transcriptional regulator